MTTHLTEAEFNDLFIENTQTPRVFAHLKECDQCRAEVTALRGATAELNRFGDAWARDEAAKAVHAPVRRTSPFGVSPLFALPVGGALAASLLAVALFLHTSPTHSGSNGRAHGPSAAEVAQDNRWLAAMDQDLQSGPDNIVIPASELQAAPRQ